MKKDPTQREFIPLDRETRAVVDTATAAHHISHQPQTLRGWAARGDGPLRALKIGGRLGWRVADLRALVGGDA